MSQTVIKYTAWSAKNRRAAASQFPSLSSVAEECRRQMAESVPKKTRDAPPLFDRPNPAVGKWAVVATEEQYEQAKEALAPLIQHRHEQGLAFAGPTAYEQGPGLLVISPPPAEAEPRIWVDRIADAALGAPPYYLLLVGDAATIPFEAQARLDQLFGTGRLDVSTTPTGELSWEACAAYASKVVRYEKGELPVQPQALLYSFASDEATRESHDAVALRLEQFLLQALGPTSTRTLFNDQAVTASLIQQLTGQQPPPAVVMTFTHGLEDTADPADWGSLTDSTFVQGGDGTPLSWRSIPAESFAPGSVVFSSACFSAGLPRRSAHRFLCGEGTQPLPEAPRTAAMPRLLLAHPEGPVAFIGHVDRSTTWSFRSFGGEEGADGFLDFAAWTLADTSGLGTLARALSTFRTRAGKCASALADELSPQRERPRTASELVDAWIGYHDAIGYVLLGDPAICVGKALVRARQHLGPGAPAQGGAPSEDIRHGS